LGYFGHSRYIGWSCALAQRMQDRVAGDQVNQQKDQRNHQSDDGNGENEASEGLHHRLDSTINQRSFAGGVRDVNPYLSI
jgi:hypothetical protein